MTRLSATRWLLGIWLGIVAVGAGIVLLQSVNGAYGTDSDVAWSWLLTLVTAPLTLVGAASFGEPTTRWKNAQASTFRYRAGFASSVVLGLGIVAVLFSGPFVEMRNFELLQASLIPLTLVQGIVVAAISSVIFEGR